MGRSHRPRPLRLGKKLRQIRSQLHLTQAEMISRLKAKEPLTPFQRLKWASERGKSAGWRKAFPSVIVFTSFRRVNSESNYLDQGPKGRTKKT
jgi:transcriptional regulator with XRE-family HTH domain